MGGHLNIIQFLQGQGANINQADRLGQTALHYAAGNGHLNVTQFYRRQGVDLNQADRFGHTALHFAAINGHLNVTRFLQGQGVDLNQANNNGRTALHWAARYGHAATVRYLINHNVQITLSDIYNASYHCKAILLYHYARQHKTATLSVALPIIAGIGLSYFRLQSSQLVLA